MELISFDIFKGTIKHNLKEIMDIVESFPEMPIDFVDMRSIGEKIEEIEHILFFIKGKKEYEAKKEENGE